MVLKDVEGCIYMLFLCAAARTKNYSGAELEGVVKSAVSYALNRQLSMDDLTKPVDEESIKVTMDDFLNALHEIVPAFGASTDDLKRCRYDFGIIRGASISTVDPYICLLFSCLETKYISKGASQYKCPL